MDFAFKCANKAINSLHIQNITYYKTWVHSTCNVVD